MGPLGHLYHLTPLGSEPALHSDGEAISTMLLKLH